MQLGQWALAMETFKSDYGYYPQIDGTFGNAGNTTNIVNPAKFAIALTGKRLDGSALPANASDTGLVGNTKRRNYYSIGEGELVIADGVPIKLQDTYGNTEFAVLYDTNGDGIINTADVSVPPSVKAARDGTFTPGPDDLDLVKGIRAGVIFYSAGKGNPDGGPVDGADAVFSWK